jgi:hypothetical protein
MCYHVTRRGCKQKRAPAISSSRRRLDHLCSKMLQPRHRPDKENQVHRLPKTPGPGKSIISKNPLKTPFHDENHTQKFHQTAKKAVVFGQSTNQPDPTKLNVFQTPGIRFYILMY